MSEEAGERTEEATQTRRDEFRSRGQVAHTKELGSGLILLFAFIIIYMSGQFFFKQILELFEASFGVNLSQAVRDDNYNEILKVALTKFVLLFMPIGLITVTIGVLSSIFQIGILNVEDALEPNFDKINPINGLQRLFSFKSIVEGIKSLLKICLVIYLLYWILSKELITISNLMDFSVMELLQFVGRKTGQLVGLVALLMIFIAVADYFYQRWDLEKQMMMTKQEIREEIKSREGNPMIKSRVRRIQREIANRRMMQNVPKADVIITNPTHIAVALKYDKNLPAPQLIAKGGDLIAEKIKAIAREHGIPIVENKPLARTIFKTLEIGQVVPRELFVAVAEVLSYVYKLKKKAMS
jgi:flagellar biosynthetic protein FlhB